MSTFLVCHYRAKKLLLMQAKEIFNYIALRKMHCLKFVWFWQLCYLQQEMKKKRCLAGSQLGEVLHLFSANESTSSCSCSSNRQSSKQLSPVDECTCELNLLRVRFRGTGCDFEAFPARQPCLVSSRGSGWPRVSWCNRDSPSRTNVSL